ncbi:class I SAM-dependent methyltransferase [Ornithinimicrobium sp. F0845]|uniref:class I SAM-dependent methyltransferase n=1 Tax=Ornithinimicrobium sp. F0845 TaxID=2926412 RepID=UPI001FF564A4|nr:class I SAM-dependent methyltransferase [Ornithinimicrobium sp. F0845]MCK0111427.1 class I SAM-dependent methyltransferase [Ornithinimicrobium sp. F0845]
MTPRVLDRWWLKAAAQGVLAAAPGAAVLDDRLRRRVRAPRLTTSYFRSKWQHVEAHLRATGREAGTGLPDSRVVELGTGWFPIVPLGLALHGATVVTIDRTAHLDPARVRLTMQVLSDLEASGQIRCAAPERLAQLRELLGDPGARTARQLLEPLAVTPVVADAQALSGVPETHGADLFVSNNTLEHIPADVLGRIFAEFLRIGSPRARMSHYIDLADHYAGFDPRINEFHFLTLTPARWRLANNRLGYQNRLRLSDYHRLLREAGWRVSGQRLTSRSVRQLEGLELVSPFDAMSAEDLLVVKAHVVTDRRA